MSTSVNGFGRQPARELSNTHDDLPATLKVPPGERNRGMGHPFQQALWEIARPAQLWCCKLGAGPDSCGKTRPWGGFSATTEFADADVRQ
jgi:hypothetical protein